FQVIEGKQVGPQGSEATKNLDTIKSGYDMNKHGEINTADKIKGGGLSREFVKNFAIVGSPERVTERLLGLKKMGLERFVVVGPGFYPGEWGEEARRLFATEVIPALREAG
ncbi:MAG: LLM class flavin-dependent oxidoreductase, partial [Novosphingobium sp.]|nr:LLM class flavin-dependent oxidoreductase [Novosphingobium sp.]